MWNPQRKEEVLSALLPPIQRPAPGLGWIKATLGTTKGRFDGRAVWTVVLAQGDNICEHHRRLEDDKEWNMPKWKASPVSRSLLSGTLSFCFP